MYKETGVDIRAGEGGRGRGFSFDGEGIDSVYRLSYSD